MTALEQRYSSYLRMERGLTAAAVAGYLPLVHRFLVERFGGGHVCPRDLTPRDISRFVLRQARSMSRNRAKLMVTALRSFFRFLMQHGEIDANLAASVPAVANWRLSRVPKYLAGFHQDGTTRFS
ncbi:MAG: site-specific integrase [Chloroflexi bacterium]|nr:site-specific integrase [Chloroflexota bacterium]